MSDVWIGPIEIVVVPASLIVVGLLIKYLYLFIHDRTGIASNEDKAALVSAAGTNTIARGVATKAILNNSLSPFKCRKYLFLIRNIHTECNSSKQLNSFFLGEL